MIAAVTRALICSILFFILSPGVIVTIPPVCPKECFFVIHKQKNGCATSYKSALCHSLIFGIIVYILSHTGLM